MDGGVDGLSVLGSTGEGALLPAPVQRRALQVTMEAKGDRPVLAGVIASIPADARDFAHMALEGGADGVLVTPPFYYLLDQEAVLSFFTYLNREVRGPVFIYHIPQFTKVTLEPETVARLADLPHIAGIKDSSRDIDFLRRLLQATDIRSLAGPGWLNRNLYPFESRYAEIDGIIVHYADEGSGPVTLFKESVQIRPARRFSEVPRL